MAFALHGVVIFHELKASPFSVVWDNKSLFYFLNVVIIIIITVKSKRYILLFLPQFQLAYQFALKFFRNISRRLKCMHMSPVPALEETDAEGLPSSQLAQAK